MPSEAGRARDVAEPVQHYTATTVPVHVRIAVDQVVLSLQEAEALLRRADLVAVGPYECHVKHHRERCFGCGLCVSGCPTRAIAFVPRLAA